MSKRSVHRERKFATAVAILVACGAVGAQPPESSPDTATTPAAHAVAAAEGVAHASEVAQAAAWNLDRIDQKRLPLDGGYRYAGGGAGVTVYVIDSGIRASHREFGGRVARGFSAVRDGRGTDDCSGHGTQVAGVVAGATYGVANRARIVPVRVLGCDGTGSMTDVIAGVNWVTAHHKKPAVANMSLVAEPSPELDRAVERSIASGVTYTVAAGNDDTDACGASPARVSRALTVGAATPQDRRATFSNFGSCVDLFAPGTRITSAGAGGDAASKVLSGTSMAAPHVAGVAALLLQHAPSSRPWAVREEIVRDATRNRLHRIGPGSPDRLLHVGP